MLRYAISALVAGSALAYAGCRSAPSATDPSTVPSSAPAYSTSGNAEPEHRMPDGTTMSGESHMDHAGHQQGAADAGAANGPTHVMPDGAVMPGHHHGAE